MLERWWFSSERMTVLVVIRPDGTIADGAPIIRTFISQPWENLQRWMANQGGFRWVRIG